MSTPSSPDRSGEAYGDTSSMDELGNVIDVPSRPSITPEPGSLVAGTYRVERELGRGGMGIVYRARDTWLDRTVALKLIVPTWDDALAEQKLQQEAKALATLRDQNVVQVYAFGRHGRSYFFAMEYVEGRSLEAILDDYRQRKIDLPQHRAITILSRIADGLDAAHARGIVHRDVKPGNIVIEEDTGRPVLIDFGLAQQSTDPNPETIEGTPIYMAPEQAGLGTDGIPVGPWSDIYALGCVAFELLTGRTPYLERNIVHLLGAHQRAPVPLASSVRPELAPFDAVLSRALAKHPVDRYPSCVTFARDLVRAGTPKAAATPSIQPAPLSTRMPGENIVRPIRVLAVDDDPAFGKFAAKAAELALKGRAVRIRVARSGQDALEAAREEPPDLVLLDLDMPDLDGVDTLSHLRALPRGDHARVVVLSGRVGPQERWKFAVLGVREFVAKPIDLRRLVDTIDGIVERAGWGAALTA
ncbi:protein kinase [Polyangium sp. 15x6]|uniref:protein kinase domain-containing protein n=1 Tax=Polyangium sp. 15x6 TaxID=3042687 RepID=UPI00249C2336|nr:protein kinase [Polyangium sp. 15x6]MDI3288932.1 protein kinase [Polyangium sp. 15x6]